MRGFQSIQTRTMYAIILNNISNGRWILTHLFFKEEKQTKEMNYLF